MRKLQHRRLRSRSALSLLLLQTSPETASPTLSSTSSSTPSSSSSGLSVSIGGSAVAVLAASWNYFFNLQLHDRKPTNQQLFLLAQLLRESYHASNNFFSGKSYPVDSEMKKRQNSEKTKTFHTFSSPHLLPLHYHRRQGRGVGRVAAAAGRSLPSSPGGEVVQGRGGSCPKAGDPEITHVRSRFSL